METSSSSQGVQFFTCARLEDQGRPKVDFVAYRTI